MKAATVAEFGPPSVIRVIDVPIPQLHAGQVRVRVSAAGVGPWDALIRAGRSGLPQSLPLILGSDIAGVIDAVAPGVSSFKVGDSVFGQTNESFTGGYAEYVIASAASIAQKPKSLSFLEAASAPVVAVTAWQMLFEYGQASAGQKVLILGAAGNVGAYAVQMARNAGLEVFATGASSDLDYLRNLGAGIAIDYRAGSFESAGQGMDIVIDTVGGDTRARSLEVLKPGGILVSVVSGPMPTARAAELGVRAVFFFADVTTARLNKISELFDSGKLAPSVGTVLTLNEAELAHQMLAGAPHKRGKIVLNVGA